MKKWILIAAGALVLLLGGGLAWHATRLEQRLVGTWKDENSLVQYRADGVKFTKFDRRPGVRKGRWYLIGNDVVYTPDDWRQQATRQTILKLTGSALELQGTEQVWHARRVPDAEMKKALAEAGMP